MQLREEKAEPGISILQGKILALTYQVHLVPERSGIHSEMT